MATKHASELERVSRLRNDVDLGLMMAEGFARAGEIGSAVRLVDELRREVSDTFTEMERRSVPEIRPARTSRWRRAVLAGGAVAALGVASAAALVGPEPTRSQDPAVRPAPARISSATEAPSSLAGRDASTVVQDDLGTPSVVQGDRPVAPDADATAPPTNEPDPFGPAELPDPGLAPPPSLPAPDLDIPEPTSLP